jgi:hypothetical protein
VDAAAFPLSQRHTGAEQGGEGHFAWGKSEERNSKIDFFCVQQVFQPFVDLWSLREGKKYICKYIKINQ